MNKLLKIDKVDISLKQLSDLDASNGSYDRVDNIRNGQILTAYVSPERTDQFRFRYLTDFLTAGSGITFSTTNGVTTISASGGGSTTLAGLTDVNLSSPNIGDVLLYDGTYWYNSPLTGGGDMLKSIYDIDNDGVVDKAETVQIVVRNSTGVTLTKGQVVYLSGATGNRPNAVLSDATTEATSSKTIGLVSADIANNADGYVTISGSMHDLDLSMFSAGDRLWLDTTPGGMVATTPPAEPNHAVFIGTVARAHPTQGRIVLAIQNGYELTELHGVLVPSPADKDVLRYNSTTGLWEDDSIATILGYTPVTNARTITINGTTYDLTANRTWTVGDLLSSGSYSNPVWLTSLAWSKITSTPTTLSGYGITDGVSTGGSYANPAWLTSLAWSKITSTPTTLSGYGITDGVSTSRTISTTSPLSGGGDLSANRTLSIADAVADGATKGAAAFTASDFNSASGVISIDYANGQKATTSQPGFLTAADWTTFNNKPSTDTMVFASAPNLGHTNTGGTTSYWAITGSGAIRSTENAAIVVMPYAGTLKNFYVRMGAGAGSSGSIVLTVRKNGADTALTLTFTNADGSNLTKSDTTNTVSVAAGDRITIGGTNNGTSQAGTLVSTVLTLER